MKISLFFLLFPLLPFPAVSQRFCYSHWPAAAVRSAIFSLSFLPPLFRNFTLLGERVGGRGVLQTGSDQIYHRDLFTHTIAGNDRFRKKERKKE